jgi:hypothetical protein
VYQIDLRSPNVQSKQAKRSSKTRERCDLNVLWLTPKLIIAGGCGIPVCSSNCFIVHSLALGIPSLMPASVTLRDLNASLRLLEVLTFANLFHTEVDLDCQEAWVFMLPTLFSAFSACRWLDASWFLIIGTWRHLALERRHLGAWPCSIIESF